MTINLPIYDCKVKFHLVDKITDVTELQKKIYKKHKVEQDIITSYAIVIPFFKIYYIVVSKEENYINSLLHELTHLVDMITEDRDIKDTEARAYLQGYIGDKLLKHVNASTTL